MDKQVYAALNISNSNVTLVVGEFFSTRFNILRVQQTKLNNKNENIDEEIITAIKKTIMDTNVALGFPIQRVLLAVPSKNVVTSKKRVSIQVEDKINREDINNGIKELKKIKLSDDLILTNVGRIKYNVNGINYYKIPLDEVCTSFIMDVDLIYADKETVFRYVSLVENCGIEVQDVCLDIYAIAEEIALFEQSVDKFVVLVDLECDHTSLGLFTQGRLVSCEILDKGYLEWSKAIAEEFKISTKAATKLLVNNTILSEECIKDEVIYEFTNSEDSKSVTDSSLYDCVNKLINEWIEDINTICNQIVETNDTRYVLTGEGFEIQALSEKLKDFNADAEIYVPQTIGGRKCDLVTNLGLFYAYVSRNEISNNLDVCTDYRNLDVLFNLESKNNEKNAFTKKFKSMLFPDK